MTFRPSSDLDAAIRLVERSPRLEPAERADLLQRLMAVRDDLCADPSCHLVCTAECRLRLRVPKERTVWP